MGFFNRRNTMSYNQYPPRNQANTHNRAAQMSAQTQSNTMDMTQTPLQDYGPMPFTVNIQEITKRNPNFRTALWSGPYLQLTLMSIPPNGEVGLENHPDVDQFLRLEAGEGLVMMGDSKDNLSYRQRVRAGDAFIIPANTWHNLINIGNTPIKLYSIYSPPNHPAGTVHPTKADADAAEEQHS